MPWSLETPFSRGVSLPAKSILETTLPVFRSEGTEGQGRQNCRPSDLPSAPCHLQALGSPAVLKAKPQGSRCLKVPSFLGVGPPCPGHGRGHPRAARGRGSLGTCLSFLLPALRPQGETRVWPDPCRAQPMPTLSPPGKPGTGEFLLPRDG